MGRHSSDPHDINNILFAIDKFQDKVSKILNKTQFVGKGTLMVPKDDENKINIILERLKQSEILYESREVGADVIFDLKSDWKMSEDDDEIDEISQILGEEIPEEIQKQISGSRSEFKKYFKTT